MNNKYINFTKFLTLLAMFGLTLNYFAVKAGNFEVEAVSNKVTICHRTASHSNPYVKITVDADSVDGDLGNDKGKGDHFMEHVGPIWSDEIAQHVEWGDIIPPVSGDPGHSGLNWTDNGQAIYNNNCKAVEGQDDIEDCTDETATNYNPEANIDDGSCTYPQQSVVPYMSSEVSCGEVKLKFSNPTDWFFSFDYRVDNEAGHDDQWSTDPIANGPFAGQLFGQRYNEVDVAADQTVNKTVNFGEDTGSHTVSYRLWRGAENDLYLVWQTVNVESDCIEPTTPPTVPPTTPPNSCDPEQFCSTSCGRVATDLPNGSCGIKHCDPTASCVDPTNPVSSTEDRPVGGTSQGQVLGATTDSYAATGVAEDIAFSLIGLTGTGLSSLGILMRRNEKK